MYDALYILVLAAAALLQLAFLTLVVLLLYRFLISKRIVNRQVVSVFIALAIVNGSLVLSAYLEGDRPLTARFFASYCLVVIGIGISAAYFTRKPEVK